MRAGRDNGVLLDKHGNTVAINLGADHVSEHEWGIKGIRGMFGMTDGIGIERRRTRQPCKHLRWIEGARNAGGYSAGKTPKPTNYAGMWLDRWGGSPEPSGDVPYFSDNQLSTGWSEGEFGAFSIEPKQIRRIREVYDALQTSDGVIWLGGGGVFQNAGLAIGIASRMDPSVLEKRALVDQEAIDVKAEFEATGIEKRLRAAGKDWFALSPKRHNGKLEIWLNPYHQQQDNFGWFTVQDLEQWIVGKGPIPMRGRK